MSKRQGLICVTLAKVDIAIGEYRDRLHRMVVDHSATNNPGRCTQSGLLFYQLQQAFDLLERFELGDRDRDQLRSKDHQFIQNSP